MTSPRAASSQLLGHILPGYCGDGSTVRDYEENKVSLPAGQLQLVELAPLLGRAAAVLESPELLLLEDDLVQERRRNEPITLFMDKVLSTDKGPWAWLR